MVHTQILLLMWRRKNWRVCGSFRSEFSGAPEIVDAKSTSSRSKGMKSNVIGLSRIECGLSIQLPSSGDTHGCVRVWGTQRWNLQSTFAGPSFRFVVPSSLVLIYQRVSTEWWSREKGTRGVKNRTGSMHLTAACFREHANKSCTNGARADSALNGATWKRQSQSK